MAVVHEKVIHHVLVAALFFLMSGTGHARQYDPMNLRTIESALSRNGFENVAVFEDSLDLMVAYENRIYRYEVRAALEVLRHASAFKTTQTRCVLIPQRRGIPVAAIIADLQACRLGTGGKMVEPCVVDVAMSAEPYWAKLKHNPGANPAAGKIDVLVHPQFRAQFGNLVNTVESQVNLAPAVSTSLWKGMSLSGQWIFPLQNELGYEGDFSRPGLLTVNQTVRLPRNAFVSGTAGYFTQHRYGTDLEVSKYWRNGRWATGVNIGCTGFAAYLKGVWYYSNMDTWTGFLFGQYRFPGLDFTVKATYGKFVYRDRGFRFDVIRQFGEVRVGFFTLKTTGGRNGGFSFSIPIFPSKRLAPARIRISPAMAFPWSYWYSGFTDTGIQYETANSVDEFIRDANPDFMLNQFKRH
jgi:hypothetical protein